MDVLKHRRLILAIWIIALAACVPAVLRYSNYISYSTSNSALSNTESGRAQLLISQVNPQNESLILVITKPNTMSEAQLANATLTFQDKLKNEMIPNLSGSVSAFSEYAQLIDKVIGNNTETIRSAYLNFSDAAVQVYSFPSLFLASWAKTGYGPLDAALKLANYSETSATPYMEAFVSALNYTLEKTPGAPALEIVQNATLAAVITTHPSDAYYYLVTKYLNVSDYSQPVLGFSRLLNTTYSPIGLGLLEAVLEPGDPGLNYVAQHGLSGAPSFILNQFVNANHTVYTIYIYFSVPSSYVGKGDTTPAQQATPTIRRLAETYFGNSSELTGDGAIAYDTQKLTAGAGFVFALTFVFLALAVALTLRSYIAPLVALIIVSAATLLGYVSIFITGYFILPVNFIVTYTLTAVLLGVSTDYLVFLLYRYRQELIEGGSPKEALKIATSRSGSAILISGLTVAASLGTFGFISGLRSWGPVLFIGVMLTVLAELTLLPALASYIGPRMFALSKKKPNAKSRGSNSYYRAAKTSVSNRRAVVLIIALLALPAIYVWFTVPTSYNFNEGLPQALPSVKALDTLQSAFGANLIYPDYAIVNLSGQVYTSNGSLTQSAMAQLQSYYEKIASTPGVSKIYGPDPQNTSDAKQAEQYLFDHGAHAYYLFYTDYSPYSPQAISVVKSLRSDPSLLVGGLTSSVIDQQSYNARIYTELELLIVAAIAIIIGVSFRSLKYPLIALSGVFISIAWTTSLLYVIATRLLHEQLLYLIPLILFVILMSLGNDYTVFIISRVTEYQKSEGFKEGIVKGLSNSAIVVTSLGIILAVSLGSLGLAPISFLRQLGISFVISLLLDTFIIRTFYFPAMIALLGGKDSAESETRLS